MDHLQLPERAQLHLARRAQLLHLTDGRGVRAEAVAAVNHHDRPGDPLQVHGPVERRVAAAHQQDALAAECLRVEHAVVQPFPVPAIHILDGQFAGGEGADAARDQHGVRRVLVLVRHDREGRLAVLRVALQARHVLAQVHRLLELERLLGHPLHEVF